VSASFSPASVESHPSQIATRLMTQAVAVTDRNGKVVWTNPAFTNLVAEPETDLSGKSILDCLRDKGHGFAELQALIKAYDQNSSEQYRVCLRPTPETLSWYQVSISPTHPDKSLSNSFCVALNDITETVRLSQSIERTKQQNGVLFDAVSAGMGEWNLEAGFVHFGPRLARMLGDEPQDWDKRTTNEVLQRCHPDDANALSAAIRALVESKQDRLRTEFRIQHKEGYWLSMLARGQVVGRNAEGKPTAISSVLVDVTELRHNDSRWRHRAQLSADWFWSTDAQGNLCEVSQEIADFIACDPKLLLNKSLPEALSMAGVKSADTANIDFLDSKITFRGIPICVERPGQADAWIELDGTPRFDFKGKFVGFEGVGRDISKQRLQEQDLLDAKLSAEHSNNSKSLFLAAMSHEIRTPMNGVLGMAEMLSTTTLDEDQAESLGIIRRSANHLLSLIDSILDFSKLDADRVEIEEREVHAGDVIYGVAESLLPIAHAKGVRLRAFSNPSIPPLTLDETRLRQVLNNLIGNAIKFSAKEGRSIGEVYIRASVEQDQWLKITVKDNGIGIAPSHLKTVFEAFNQAEISTTRRYGGTGLGLAISKKLIELMGGRIEVSSVLDEGSTFTLHLPMKLAGQAALSHVSLENKHCVIVGAESSENQDLQAALIHAGATVRLVASITSGLALVNSIKRPTIYLHNEVGPSESSYTQALKAHSWPKDVTHLLVTDGTRKSLRMIDEKIACVDWGRSAVLTNAVSIISDEKSQIPDNAAAAKKRLGGITSPKKLAKLSSTLKVLVAEDDPINQRVISKQLAHFGVQADFANNGVEALELWLAHRQYSLVLTDLHMPEMDGYELTRCIRGEETGSEHVPIIALTANAVTGETFEAYKAGVDLYLTKPILLDDLHVAISTFAIDYAAPDAGEDGEIVAENRFGEKPHFDGQTLIAVLGDDQESVCDLLEHYINEAAGMIDRVQTAIASGDLRASKVLAHRLKSSSRSVGALRLGDIFAEVEAMQEAATSEDIDLITTEIQHSFARFKADAANVLAKQEN
jgi:signal transduction histidine kinase/CheY-like chemotaxis protein